jgi:hypothetical protein
LIASYAHLSLVGCACSPLDLHMTWAGVLAATAASCNGLIQHFAWRA